MLGRGRMACSFCGRGEAEVGKLVAGPQTLWVGPRVYICDACVARSAEIMGRTAPAAEAAVQPSAARKVNLSEKLGLISEPWSPKIVGQVNDFHVKLVKLRGEFIWHAHEAEDELFLVLNGRLRMQLRSGEVPVDPGEFLVVPRRTEHCPVADGEAHVLLLEPASTINTGGAVSDRTRQPEWI